MNSELDLLRDKNKSKEQLIKELEELRTYNDSLKRSEDKNRNTTVSAEKDCPVESLFRVLTCGATRNGSFAAS